MKLDPAKTKVRAFTLVELLVILFIVAIFVAVLLPARSGRGPSSIPRCMSRLKQIDLTVLMYSQDYGDQLPWQPLQTNNLPAGATSAATQFKTLSDYYKHLPSLLTCPSDKTKVINTNLETFTDHNVSYFLNIDAPFTNRPAITFFSGDRNLKTAHPGNGFAVKPGLFVLRTNDDIGWTTEIHPSGGNLAFADGHVQYVKTTNLNSFVQQLPIVTNRLLIP